MKELKMKLKGTTISELGKAYDKTLAWFFAYPQKEFTLNELCKSIGIAKTTANVVISQLEKEGFLEKEILGKVWRIKVNQKHPYVTTRKIPFNLQQIYESGIPQWVNDNIPNAKAIILFGSYRKGDDIEGSDIDIAVEILGNQKLEIITGVMQALGYRKNIKVNLHVFSRKHIDLNVFANIANGIVLNGFLEVHP